MSSENQIQKCKLTATLYRRIKGDGSGKTSAQLFLQFLSALLGMTAFNMGTGLGERRSERDLGWGAQKQVWKNHGHGSCLVLGTIPKQLPGAGSGANAPPRAQSRAQQGVGQTATKIPSREAKTAQKRTWYNPLGNASPAADHCSLYEFTQLIFLIWWAKLLSADIQHPLMKLQVLSTF